MKQILFALLAVSISTMVTTNGAYAQKSVNTQIVKPEKNIIPVEKVIAYPNNSISETDSINPEALKHFTNTYKNATGESWLKIKDGFTTRFTLNGVMNTIYYNTKGRWTGSLKNYREDKMPHDIRDIVKREYYDYSITSVDEVETIDSGGIPTYVVHLAGENNIKLVRICERQMDVWTAFILQKAKVW